MTAVRDATTELVTVAGGLDHPEGVAWHDGCLWCGTEHGELLRIDPADGSHEVVARTGGFLLGLAFDGAGVCFACDVGTARVLRIEPDGSYEPLVDAVAGRRLRSPNFPALSPDGTLWVSDSGSAWGNDDGFLFRVRPGADPEIVDDACRRFPNGIAFAPGGERLYVVESRLPGVSTYDVRDGRVGERVELLRLEGTVPDGLAFAADGALYIGCWRPDRVYRLSPGGALEIYLDDYTGEYLTTPTNLAFGGPDGRTLFLASLSGWSIRALTTGSRGLDLARPRRSPGRHAG